MTCYHPLKGFVVGLKENGKKDIIICSNKVQYVYRNIDKDVWYKSECPLPIKGLPLRYVVVTDYEEIPCGNCIGCRLKYSSDWATRCMLESKYHEYNYFVTLTYNDSNVPISYYIDDDGNVKDSFTLVKRDLQLFFKRLRKNYKYDNKLRFYACGEYGGQTFRPHYHCIIFGLKLDDLKFYKSSPLGDNYYTSEFLNSCWKKGYVIIGQCDWDSCAYVARYVMKKAKGLTSDIYKEYGKEPEFVNMSRKPGIARQYFEEYASDIYINDEIVLSTRKGGKALKPPRYFDTIFEDMFPEAFENVKSERLACSNSIKDWKIANNDLNYYDLLEIEEREKEKRVEKLKRVL